MKGSIMLQGTASNVGKSMLAAGLCRVLKQDGYLVAPFKSQNMALNSYITQEGHEMGRAQVMQAEAAGIVPSVKMNPILLKPTSDRKSQIIVNGKVFGHMNATDYYDFKVKLKEMVKCTYDSLAAEYDVVVIEGAGSPAEINLKENDIVNMGMAEMADSPVVLIGDIDRGGVFAALAGTMLLLTPNERERVKGVIINKFRGDIKLLEPGIKQLEEIIKVPVLGVVPYVHLDLEDEDSLSERLIRKGKKDAPILVEVIQFPHLSNFSDFTPLEVQEDVSLRYVHRGEHLTSPDIIILPGTKNTLEDLLYLRQSGLEKEIQDLHQQGKLIIGICGGYQMLGEKLLDPNKVESSHERVNGIGLLPMQTIFEKEKMTTQVEAVLTGFNKDFKHLNGLTIKGYEIHMGSTSFVKEGTSFAMITKRLGEKVCVVDGAVNDAQNVIGTYCHGIFENLLFTRGILNELRKRKGLPTLEASSVYFEDTKEKAYNKLADTIRESLDMEKIYEIIKGQKE